MSELLSYPDEEWALSDAFASLVGGVTHSGIVPPPNLQDLLPYVVVQRSGGPFDGNKQFHPQLDVDFYGPTRAATKTAADLCVQLLQTTPLVVSGTLPDGTTPYVCVIDEVNIQVGPRRLPTGDDNTWRFGITLDCVVRPRRAS